MGCAQAKPSRGSPARSDGRGIDRLKRDNSYRPGGPGVSRFSDPPPPAAERATEPAHAARRGAAAFSGRSADKTPDDDASAAAVAPAPPLPPPPRREDELVDGWPTWLLDNVPREALQGIVPRSADAYDKIEKVGQGTYSNVYKARERGTGRVVALKKVRFDTSESESVRFMAREIRILQRLDHPNVIRLEGIATSRMHRSIYLVFEFMYSDLTKLIARPGQRLTEPQVGNRAGRRPWLADLLLLFHSRRALDTHPVPAGCCSDVSMAVLSFPFWNLEPSIRPALCDANTAGYSTIPK
jgi:cyclin-dependent kinase 12/13